MKKRAYLWKKWGGRAFSLLLALFLLAGSLPLRAMAAEGGEEPIAPPEGWEEAYNSLPSEEKIFSAPVYTGNFVDYRSQLTARQKTIYDVLRNITPQQILSAPLNTQAYQEPLREIQRHVAGVDGTTVTYSGEDMTPASQAVVNAIWNDYFSARVALRYDHPELRLWIDNIKPLYTHQRVSGNTYRITSMCFYFEVIYKGREKTLYDTMMSSARTIAAQASRQPDTWSKVRAAHDIIVQGSTYGYGADGNPVSIEASPLSHTAYSALVSGDPYEPVCSGYADAMKIVCDLMGIPCALADSATHRWNKVKMDDGLWYNLDLTWDDGEGDNYHYTYFLVGSDTLINGERFCRQESHVEVGLSDWYNSHSGYRYATLRYPVTNKTAYMYLGSDYPPTAFRDVPRSAYCYDAVEWASGRGITNGTAPSMFSPEASCTRAQAVTFLWRAAGEPEPVSGVNPFTDVKETDFCYKAVLWAVENGVTNGTGEAAFSPGKTCSRGEIVTFQHRAAGSPAAPAGQSFTDVKEGQYYSDAVHWAVEQKVTNGVGEGRFGPADPCKRGQIVTFLYRQLA